MWLLWLCAVPEVEIIVKVSMTVKDSVDILLSHSMVNALQQILLIKVRMLNLRKLLLSRLEVIVKQLIF